MVILTGHIIQRTRNRQLTLVIVSTIKILIGIPMATLPQQAIPFQFSYETKQMPTGKSDGTFVFNNIRSKHNQDHSLNPLAAASKLFEHDEVPIYQ